MKKNMLLMAVAVGLLSVTACKKETTTTTETTVDTLTTESTTVTTEETTVDPAVQANIDEAKVKYDKAEADVKAAVEKGDKKSRSSCCKGS